MNKNFLPKTLSLLLCASVIASCGSSNGSKAAKKDQVGQTTSNQTTSPVDPSTQNPQVPANRPTETASTNEEAAPTGENKQDKNEAPLGRRTDMDDHQSEDKKDKKKTATSTRPSFNESKALFTGGKVGEMNYTSAADDGIMELFRSRATSVPEAQQMMNQNLASAVTSARLVVSGSSATLDLAMNESGAVRTYRLNASQAGNHMKLSSAIANGDLEFQDGFLKCLDDSCENSYAKIKFSGAYVRIIFRTDYMNNHFMIQADGAGSNFDLWKTYINNTTQGSASDMKIKHVRAASYEVLNGKSAMGVQIIMENQEAVSFNFQLTAPNEGTSLNGVVTRVQDLSTHYGLPSTASKANNLGKAITETKLVNNNGKGQVKLEMKFGTGSIWMVLSKIVKTTMTAEQVREFEAKLP